MKVKKFKNYGDVNFFDGGCLIREIEENVFEVIKCNYDCDKENNHFLTHDIIDITDSWIDKDAVESYADIAFDNAQFASDIVSYYGTQDCRGVMQLSKNGVIDYMEKFEESIEYKFFFDNLNNYCRNIVAEITYHNGARKYTLVRDTTQEVFEYFADCLEAGDTLKIIEI